MVRGIEKFREYFKDFPNSYIIIGGTACDIIIEDAGLKPRATKDFDIILVVEALEPEFVQQFWSFIKDGNYGQKEKSPEERKYYRFLNPENTSFPKQVELFSRIPDLLDLDIDTHLTPIPVDDDLSSLSAILMDEDYYNFTIQHSTVEEGVHLANIEALICLKAKAFIDMSARKANGENIDDRNIRKHKTDVFRMAVMLPAENTFELPPAIKNDLQIRHSILDKPPEFKPIFRINCSFK
ncbi:hypothetical protein LA303_09040 [Candidatus Sulfidibacterium hydrothermale]|uniref:hypothetical protein n=1 Tax=Candidatus Sulfidibacterium hydrothermale TaxID=2875962 RepID=UPI001F0ABFB0|nr:hypothetical protein [Candidatus Sulfidibacterium hydrothermale]UBM61559.1 hypothetical protein LA303_09040 [Candidatus Sulfidibacterium hydrothermale]